MAEEGHIVGNHTWHHYNMSQIADLQSFTRELQSVADQYREATGEEMLPYYRPPQGVYSEENLKKILFNYGEERFAPKIAAKIVEERAKKPIETTAQLSELIKAAMPAAAKEGGHHPAKRSFQAIRIEVNSELDVIAPAINAAVERMNKGGRIAVITFHSLEDRIVKQTFATLATRCTCPKSLPVCICNHKPKIKCITKKPILPGERETEENPRARSAKLRVAEKL